MRLGLSRETTAPRSIENNMATATSSRRKEEQNLHALRELAALPCNKKCLECQQKGPTYVDMTTCGFVCITCSGYLRGLNPPHRVKSISMTSFKDSEISLIQQGGNEIARSIWLGKWNAKRDKEPDKKDDVAFKEFLVSKYERKQWYVNPSEVKANQNKEEAAAKPEPRLPAPPSSKADKNRSPQPPTSTSNQSSTTAVTTVSPAPQTPKVDLLAGLDNDPFTPKVPTGGVSVLPVGNSHPLVNAPKQADDFGAFTAATTADSSNILSAQSLQSTSTTKEQDKYAALVSLDESLKELKIKEDQHQQLHVQSQSQQQMQPQNHQFNPFGGSTTGPPGMPAQQQQSNPFLASNSPVTGVHPAPGSMMVGGAAGGGFGVFQGVQGQQPMGNVSGQAQQFGAFGQPGAPAGMMGAPYGQQQWTSGQQQVYGMPQQGAQPQPQWRPQMQMAPQQQSSSPQWVGGFSVSPGMVPTSQGMGGGTFGGQSGLQTQQQQQQQFGSFVSVGNQHFQQQYQQGQQAVQQQGIGQRTAPSNQFNWQSASQQAQQQQRKQQQQSPAPPASSTNWSDDLTKPPPPSSWGLVQQNQQSQPGGLSSWSDGLMTATAQSSSGQGAGWGAITHSQAATNLGASGSSSSSIGGFGQSSPSSFGVGGSGQLSGVSGVGFGQQSGAFGFQQQPSSQDAGGFQSHSFGAFQSQQAVSQNPAFGANSSNPFTASKQQTNPFL